MTATPFSTMPDDARLWVFPVAGTLQDEQADHLLAEVDRFIDGWTAHGHAVQGARQLLEKRFVLIAADERASGVSGCSIDTLFRRLQSLEREIDVPLTDVSPVWFRDGNGQIESVTRPEFRAMARDGRVGAQTRVFDPTVGTVGDLRGGRFETQAGQSWHGRLLP